MSGEGHTSATPTGKLNDPKPHVHWKLILSGVLLLAIPLGMAVLFPQAYGDSQSFLRIVAALGAGLVGSQIPGFLRLKFEGGEALGGIALSLLILTYDPLFRVDGALQKPSVAEKHSRQTPAPAPTESTGTNQQRSLEGCIVAKRQAYEQVKEMEIVGGARVGGPGIGGGRRQASENVCLSAGAGQQFLSAVTRQVTCHGGRCSVTAPVIEQRSVCVTATAWSEGRSFGGGGSGQYRLIAKYRDVASEQQQRVFEAACRAELN